MVGVLPSATDPASRVPNFLKHYSELPWAGRAVSLSFFALRSDIWASGYFTGLASWLTHQAWLAIHSHLDQGIQLDNHHILSWANLGSLGGHLSPTVSQGDGEHGGPESPARLHISKLVRWESDQLLNTKHVIPALQSGQMWRFQWLRPSWSWSAEMWLLLASINNIYQTIFSSMGR